MKKVCFSSCFIFLLYLTFFPVNAVEYEPQKILIKFKEGSELYKNLLENKRTGEIAEFKDFTGLNLCKGYLSDASLILLNKKLSENNKLRTNSKYKRGKQEFEDNKYFANEGIDYIFPETQNLMRIFLVEFKKNIDVSLLAKKISNFDFIEYAEPIPLKKIVGVPNDSLIYRQYYLNQIKIFEAWDNYETDSSIVIGIVDTGIDYFHEDLKDKLWYNIGEIGKDVKGNDRRNNSIDDDNNGFVDDWRGWDFVSSENTSGDNDPKPGHIHGTHVAGIAAASTHNVIGIAGIDKGAKLLAVKVAGDNPFSTSVSNSYEGILYAASMGADVINCSWGSESRSEAEMEILTTAAELGAVVVAAAGNDGTEVAFYPASHRDVISVASVDFDDKKSGFSNYHYSVDVSAPGEDIYSTIPGDDYDYLDGTSMASPVVAGIAGIVKEKYPDYLPIQIKEHIKASSDDIDTLNPFFIGKLGKGRVNAYQALQDKIRKSVVLQSYYLADESNDNILEIGEKVEISLTVQNVLSPLTKGRIEAFLLTGGEYIEREIEIGSMSSMEELELSKKIIIKLPQDVPNDYLMNLELAIYDDEEFVNSVYITFVMNPSYRTLKSNDITVTFNSRGNIGFNDYPSNVQGDGFNYKSSGNILYEGALMLGLAPGKVSNVARTGEQMQQDRSFIISKSLQVKKPGTTATEEAETEFISYESETEIAVKVKQSIFQFNDEINKDIIYVVYDIINTSGNDFDTLRKDYDSLYAGLYFDWDIGPSGSNNYAKFEETYGFGYVRNKLIDTLPLVGVAMLSGYKPNFFAIDNPGTSNTNPGVWDGFYRWEKWLMLSSGIYRKESSLTDVSMVIGAGPLKVKPGDTVRVAFSIFAANNMVKLRENCRNSRLTAKEYGIADGKYNPLPKTEEILQIYPNPIAQGQLHIDYALTDGSYITIDLYNSLGQKVLTAVKDKFSTAGYQSEIFDVPNLAQGRYYIKLTSSKSVLVKPFEIIY